MSYTNKEGLLKLGEIDTEFCSCKILEAPTYYMLPAQVFAGP
jgi:hypothetical protein